MAVKCPECGARVSNAARYCPDCGSGLTDGSPVATGSQSAGSEPAEAAKGEVRTRRPSLRVTMLLMVAFVTVGLMATALYLRTRNQLPHFKTMREFTEAAEEGGYSSQGEILEPGYERLESGCAPDLGPDELDASSCDQIGEVIVNPLYETTEEMERALKAEENGTFEESPMIHGDNWIIINLDCATLNSEKLADALGGNVRGSVDCDSDDRYEGD